MKVQKLNILAICNMSHSDFGVFAKFLDGLGKGNDYIEIPQPNQVFLCKKCYRPLWIEEGPCTYCLGLEDGQKGNPFKDHEHTWTAEGKISCIKCGIFQDFISGKGIKND